MVAFRQGAFQSFGSAPPDAFTGTITLTSPGTRQGYQRNGSNQADIPITFNYTIDSGTLSGGVRARFDGGAWQTIVASPSGGSGSGTLTAQGKGEGDLQISFVNAPSITDTETRIKIGDGIVLYGQSNSDSGGSTDIVQPQAPVAHSSWQSTVFQKNDTWVQHTEGITSNWFSDANGGPYAIYANGHSLAGVYGALATLIMDEEDCPVYFIPCGKGSVSQTDYGGLSYNPTFGNQTDPTTLFGAANLRVAAAGNNYKFVVYFQGEFEANQSRSDARVTNYAADQAQLISDWETNMVSPAKWVTVAISATATAATSWDLIYAAQLSMIGNSSVVAVADMESPTRTYAGLHPETTTEINAVARRLKDALYP